MIRSMAEVYTLCILSDVGYSVGNYMQMMIVLKPIAFDVIIYMTQLFDYYLYAVNIHILWLHSIHLHAQCVVTVLAFVPHHTHSTHRL